MELIVGNLEMLLLKYYAIFVCLFFFFLFLFIIIICICIKLSNEIINYNGSDTGNNYSYYCFGM